MRKNTASKEGFIPNLNYPKNRKSRYGRNYPWTIGNGKETRIGRFIKTAIGIWGDNQAGISIEIERSFKAQGVGEDAVLFFIKSNFPEFPHFYREIRGTFITKSVAGGRYHKQWYDNKAPQELRGRRSDEHYMHDSKLRPLVPAVDERLKLGGPVSLAEILKIVAEVYNESLTS